MSPKPPLLKELDELLEQRRILRKQLKSNATALRKKEAAYRQWRRDNDKQN